MGGEGTPHAVEEALREQLRLAMLSAQSAFQDSARLIRLLTILGHPGTPEDLVEETLITLSAVFQIDVASVVRVVKDHLVVTASCGLPEDDPAFVVGWVPSPTTREVLRTGRATNRQFPSSPEATGPEAAGPLSKEEDLVRQLGLRSAAWLPLPGDDDRIDHLLILYRRREDAFTRTEMELLDSVASRLLMVVQARRRAVAMERLARTSHALSQHRRIGPLLRDATRLLRELVAAERMATFSITNGHALPVVQAARDRPGTDGTDGDPPWDLGGCPAEQLPGWDDVLDGSPHLLRVERPGGIRHLLVVPAGSRGSPDAVLYADWTDLPPMMLPTVETAAIFATTLTAAMQNAALYRALSASETSLRAITDSISDLIAVVDGSCRFLYASASYDRAVDHTPGSLIGRSLLDLVETEDRIPLRNALHTSMATASPSMIEYRLLTGDGRVVWAESQLRPAALSDRRVVMSTPSVNERRLREDELRHQALHDPLTGLANRASATKRLEEVLSADGPGEIGLLFCDLNKFKQVNDRLGHAAGDALLQEVADRLRRCTRTGDLIARLGGDEFVFILDGITTLDEVMEVGRRVAQVLRRPFLLGGEALEVSASVGASVGRRGEASPAKMMSSADAAMYAAKRSGSQLDLSSVTRVVG